MNPFDPDSSQDDIRKGVAEVFRAVSLWFVDLHGKPLSHWRYQDECGWKEAATGKRIHEHEWIDDKAVKLPDALAPWEPICDGKRDMGGAVERYLDTHWAMVEFLRDVDWSVWRLLTLSMAYGWAAAQLAHDVPILNALIPAEIEIPPIDVSARIT